MIDMASWIEMQWTWMMLCMLSKKPGIFRMCSAFGFIGQAVCERKVRPSKLCKTQIFRLWIDRWKIVVVNLHHSDKLLHDGDVEEGEVVDAGALHVGDDHHALDVQLVGALLFEERLFCQFLIRGIISNYHLDCCWYDHLALTLTAVDMIIWQAHIRWLKLIFAGFMVYKNWWWI